MIGAMEPGDLGWMISMHGVIYSREFHFDSNFEVDIARKAIALCDKKDGFSEIWIKKVAGENAGSIAVSNIAEGVAFINFVLVLERYRGQGIAGELMRHALDYAKTQGCHQVKLETYSSLTNARKLYATLGFRISGPVKQLEKYGQTFEQEFWAIELKDWRD